MKTEAKTKPDGLVSRFAPVESLIEDRQAEVWMSIPVAPAYEASSLGRIKRVLNKFGNPNTRILKPWLAGSGVKYQYVSLSWDGGRLKTGVHRLVAMAFHGCPLPDQEVLHIDHNPLNNYPGNLEWGSHSKNVCQSVSSGRHRPVALCGERHHKAKITMEIASEIKKEAETSPQRGWKTKMARRLGVSVWTVSRVSRGVNWKRNGLYVG